MVFHWQEIRIVRQLCHHIFQYMFGKELREVRYEHIKCYNFK